MRSEGSGMPFRSASHLRRAIVRDMVPVDAFCSDFSSASISSYTRESVRDDLWTTTLRPSASPRDADLTVAREVAVHLPLAEGDPVVRGQMVTYSLRTCRSEAMLGRVDGCDRFSDRSAAHTYSRGVALQIRYGRDVELTVAVGISASAIHAATTLVMSEIAARGSPSVIVRRHSFE